MRQSEHKSQTWQGPLELSDQEFKTTTINRLRAPADKVDVVQEQIRHASREIQILRKNQKELKRTIH